MASDVIHLELDLTAPPGQAFSAFAEDLGSWWPREYTWSRETLDEIGIEGWEHGMCYEVGPFGFRCDWGRVLAWEPGKGLTFSWQIGPGREPVPDPGKASEVHVQFLPVGAGSRLVFEHRNLRKHGQGWEAYCDALAAPEGWPYILGCLATSF